MSEKELNIYNNEVKRLENIIESIKMDIEKLKEKERNDILEFEALVNILQNLGNKFKNLKSVQKQKIVQLWVLNIIIKDDLSVIIYINPAIQEFFARMGQGMEYFSNSFDLLNTELKEKQDILNCFYAIINHNKDLYKTQANPFINNNLST